jgi:hypothetical protein
MLVNDYKPKMKMKPKVQLAYESLFLLFADEQKPISWEDPLPRSSNNLNTLNNNQETSFYHHPQILHLNSIVNNNHLNNSSGGVNTINHHHHHLHKPHKKLEHTSSVRSTISSEDSWCPSEDHDNDDISSTYNDEDDALSDRSNSLISSARNSQLRLTFNKAKQHLSFDKWRNNSTSAMPSSNVQNQESPGEPLSRLSRWFSIRRGSHQYDLNTSSSATSSPNRSGSIEKENDEKLANGKKMPQLQEVS